MNATFFFPTQTRNKTRENKGLSKKYLGVKMHNQLDDFHFFSDSMFMVFNSFAVEPATPT